MSLFTYLLRKSMKSTSPTPKPGKPKVKPGTGPIKKGVTVKIPFKGKTIYKGPPIRKGPPIKKKTLSSNGTDFLKSLVSSTVPGSAKMEFPFKSIPPVSVNVGLEKSTTNAILGLGGLILGSVVVGSVLKNRLKTS